MRFSQDTETRSSQVFTGTCMLRTRNEVFTGHQNEVFTEHRIGVHRARHTGKCLTFLRVDLLMALWA